MSELSPADIAARVVAWHNRHPLAQRLRVADVHSIGHVALPFALGAEAAASAPPTLTSEVVAGAGGSLRERAMARAREAPAGAEGLPASQAATTRADSAADSVAVPAPRPAFREDFIPPLSPADVGAFAATHGIARAAEPTGSPVRRVPASPGTGSVAWRWVLTAELRGGSARTRVLLGAAPGAPVLGRRLWSLPRVGALAALGGAAAALALTLALRDAAAPPLLALPGAAPAAPAAASMPVSVPASAAAVPVLVAASAPLAASASPEPPASRPLDVEPRLGRIDLPPIGTVVDARRRAAAASAPGSTAASMPGASPAAVAAPAPAASAPVFALATRPLRTRTESQQIAEALKALLVVPGSPVQHVDVIRAGDDFRVVAWPYPGRAEAERAQSALQARGHRLQLIAF